MQDQQSMHLRSSTRGRCGAVSNAPVGQVARQAPQAVQSEVMETVTFLLGSRVA